MSPDELVASLGRARASALRRKPAEATAGAHALGLVAPLFDAREVETGDVAAIQARGPARLAAIA